MISEQSSSLSQHRTIILSPDSLKYLYQKGRQISNKCLVLGNAKYFSCELIPQLDTNMLKYTIVFLLCQISFMYCSGIDSIF